MADPLIIPPGYVHMSWKVTASAVGHVCMFTMGAKLASSDWTSTQRTELYNDVTTALRPLWDGQVVINGYHALVGSDGPPTVWDVSGSVTGSQTLITQMPPNVSYLLQKKTGFGGKQYRGRLFLPFVDSTNTSEGGVLVGTHLTRLQAVVTPLLAAANTSSGGGLDGWYLLHRASNTGAAPAPTLITDLVASSYVATQRRRLVRA